MRQARNLGLQSIAAEAPVYAPESTQTDSVSEHPVFLGREMEVSSVVDKLITTTERELSVLPIVGMGGLGKTTLAREVFNHEHIISHFGDKLRVWVHVPRTFDEVVLLERILASIGKESEVPQGNREALLEKLREHLGAKKYLLVLDDIWNEDSEKWGGFVGSLSRISSATGNCTIVTTRSHRVASIVNTLPIHELGYLSGDDCWSIIKATAFISSENVPMEIETMGRHIAKKCQGLPLAAKVVGGILRGKPQDIWQEIENNWFSKSRDGQNPIPDILKLRYDNLSSPSLKKCFAHCSIFPEGYQIEKEQLIELWIAEGFLQTETMGSKFFDLLLQNSLLQVARSDDYNNITHGYMNDLVHDLARSILVNNGNVAGDICQSRYFGDGFLSFTVGEKKYVRTLFFGGEVSDIRFSDFESLRSLTLVGHHINELPTSIRQLKYLRYLDISKTSIEYLPDWVGELYHLQTLRENNDAIGRQCYLEKLPDSLSCLVRLRHLHISKYTKLPPGIGKLSSLQTLLYFHVGSQKGYGISELGKLNDLKGKIEICNVELVRDNEATSALLSQKPGIYKLKLVWDKFRKGFVSNDETVLKGLQPHPNLERLEICGYKGKNLLPWEGLNNLMEIKLTDCSECEELPMLRHLPNVKVLEIWSCPKITNLVPCLGGGGFPSPLRKLRIINCRSLRVLPGDPHIETLYISECPDLKSIPSRRGEQQEGFTSLRQLHISNCEGLTDLHGGGEQQQGFTSLRQLHINNCEGLTDLPIEMVESCAASLEELKLIGLSSITNFGMVIGCLNRMTRLRELEITRVPEFSITGSLSTNKNMQTLRMGPSSSDNYVSFKDTVNTMLAQFISLRRLTLFGMGHWDRLPDQLQHLTSLAELSLHDFGIEALPELFGKLSSSLKELRLIDCKRLRHLPSKEAMQRLSKLTDLYIFKCPLLLKEKRINNYYYHNYHHNYDLDHDYDYDQIPQIDDSEWHKISHIRTIKLDGCRISSGH